MSISLFIHREISRQIFLEMSLAWKEFLCNMHDICAFTCIYSIIFFSSFVCQTFVCFERCSHEITPQLTTIVFCLAQEQQNNILSSGNFRTNLKSGTLQNSFFGTNCVIKLSHQDMFCNYLISAANSRFTIAFITTILTWIYLRTVCCICAR